MQPPHRREAGTRSTSQTPSADSTASRPPSSLPYTGQPLARTKFPVNVIHGEESFAENDDWGYGPPRYLRPERVRLAAEALQAINYDQLVSGVDPVELTSAEVYPLGWSEPGALEWGRHWYDGLTQFLEAAAGMDDAVLVWLD
ncbi:MULTISPECIES: YfbM family protein [unclassified Streptomyces]|uniref:YfbM family protein n=1 Tax=unclassified Streptomyces TaxID=2593676 RepID=UPI00087D97A2|nr:MULTISPECIES: YfbM family protein [unclassified Streptomyces]SDT68398.1 protein of unknown function [Streptomyces sp. 2114.2]